jgi:hypothetical protein
MVTHRNPATRLILAGGFAAALLAGPAAATVLTGPTGVTAACTSGESEDLYSTVCVPDLVPNTPNVPSSAFSSIPGNPDLPAVDGIPCTGANSGQCIGLAEDQPAPVVQPRTSVSASP